MTQGSMSELRPDREGKRVILLILDGLAYETAKDCMGYLQALVEQNLASLYRLPSALPSNSRPLYETLLTGCLPLESGIINNAVSRLSNQQSVFSLARQHGLLTAAAAYHWFSELYNQSPYLPLRDRDTHNDALPIQYGRFYHNDDYPTCHLLLDAEYLRRRYQPDFLLVHPMSIDAAGHQAGVDSSHYRNTVRQVDVMLSDYLSTWIEEGYQIVLTSDHGMNQDNSHGGALACERDVPLFVIGNSFSHHSHCRPKQTDICGIICQLLGLSHQKALIPALLRSALCA